MPPLLIDTDTAGDDVTSLIFGMRWPGIDLVGLTIVAGNVDLDLCVRNALLTREACGREDVPVFAGADAPLDRPLVTAHYVHGVDGMGTLAPDPPRGRAEDEHAVDALIRLASEYDGELIVIAQAPLTNIALALRKDPGLPSRIRHLWIMGGSNNHVGNITPAAEFNFYVDPLAAHEVLRGGFRTTVVPWDVCLNDGIITREELQPVMDMDSPVAGFYLHTQRSTWDFMKRVAGVDGISHPDSLTIAMALDRSVITASKQMFVDVETTSALSRGYSLMDVNGVLDHTIDRGVVVHELMDVSDPTPNAEVVLAADRDRFRQMLFDVLR